MGGRKWTAPEERVAESTRQRRDSHEQDRWRGNMWLGILKAIRRQKDASNSSSGYAHYCGYRGDYTMTWSTLDLGRQWPCLA